MGFSLRPEFAIFFHANTKRKMDYTSDFISSFYLSTLITNFAFSKMVIFITSCFFYTMRNTKTSSITILLFLDFEVTATAFSVKQKFTEKVTIAFDAKIQFFWHTLLFYSIYNLLYVGGSLQLLVTMLLSQRRV